MLESRTGGVKRAPLPGDKPRPCAGCMSPTTLLSASCSSEECCLPGSAEALPGASESWSPASPPHRAAQLTWCGLHPPTSHTRRCPCPLRKEDKDNAPNLVRRNRVRGDAGPGCRGLRGAPRARKRALPATAGAPSRSSASPSRARRRYFVHGIPGTASCPGVGEPGARAGKEDPDGEGRREA